MREAEALHARQLLQQERPCALAGLAPPVLTAATLPHVLTPLTHPAAQLARKPFPRSGTVVPERYLEATGECFILMLLVSWILTYLFNPDVIENNPLKSRVGYNNMCVGFDTPPARYAAMPLQVLQAFLTVRYASLDNTRASLEKRTGRISRKQYWFSRVANTAYGVFMLCFPVLLVLTPRVNTKA